MKRHEQEAISGLLDRELTRRQRRRVVGHLRACPQCITQYRRQRQVRRLVREHAPAPAMPLDAELFWNGVRHGIQATEPEPARAITPAASWLDWVPVPRWALVSVATASVVVVVALTALWYPGLSRPGSSAPGPVAGVPPPVNPPPRPTYAEVERAATVLPNTSVTPFDSEPAGVTVLWVDGLPWTADMTEMKTLYANLDS
ncbi:zf-HC2 domain-containing protein [bacterium]|nr:zf-HC2 domain-containing protein [bacterium]